MFKWFITFLYALKLMRQWSISFHQAWRFVRCDHLIQEEIDRFVN